METAMEKNLDIVASLMSERKKAIEDLDFNRAEEIHNELQREFSRQSSESFNTFQMQNNEAIQSAIDDYKSKALLLKTENNKTEEKLRKEFLDKMNDLQSNLNRNLSDLKASRDEKLDDCEFDNSKYLDLIEKAKIAATAADFSRARELKAAAEQAEKESYMGAAHNIEENYKELCDKARSDFESKRNATREDYYQKLYVRRNDLNRKLDAAKRSAILQIDISHQKTEAMVRALTTNNREKEQMMETLTEKRREAVESINSFRPAVSTDEEKEVVNNTPDYEDETFLTAQRPKTARTVKVNHLNSMRSARTRDLKTMRTSGRMTFTATKPKRHITPKSVFF